MSDFLPKDDCEGDSVEESSSTFFAPLDQCFSAGLFMVWLLSPRYPGSDFPVVVEESCSKVAVSDVFDLTPPSQEEGEGGGNGEGVGVLLLFPLCL